MVYVHPQQDGIHLSHRMTKKREHLRLYMGGAGAGESPVLSDRLLCKIKRNSY